MISEKQKEWIEKENKSCLDRPFEDKRLDKKFCLTNKLVKIGSLPH